MTIKLNVTQDSEGSPIHELIVDGKEVARIASLSECPEDAIIGRDLIDGNDIIRYIKMGWDAARRGEPLEIDL